MLIIIGSVEDDLGTRLGSDVTRRNRLSHDEGERERRREVDEKDENQ